MTCREFQERIEDLALGDVDPSEAGALRAHAADCPACAARLEEAQALNARLRGLREAYALPAGLEDKVRAALRPEPQEKAAPLSARSGPAWIRLWRWAPAAAAALLIAAVAALFLAGPGPAVPTVVADTFAAYDGLSARGDAPDIRNTSGERVQAFFRDRLLRDVPTPCVHAGCTCPPGACPCGLVGGRVCDVPSAGGRVPFVLYDRGGTTLALLVVDPARLGPGVLASARRVKNHGHTVRLFESRDLAAAVCPDCNPGFLWVARLPGAALVETFHAALAERSGNRGH